MYDRAPCKSRCVYIMWYTLRKLLLLFIAIFFYVYMVIDECVSYHDKPFENVCALIILSTLASYVYGSSSDSRLFKVGIHTKPGHFTVVRKTLYFATARRVGRGSGVIFNHLSNLFYEIAAYSHRCFRSRVLLF